MKITYSSIIKGLFWSLPILLFLEIVALELSLFSIFSLGLLITSTIFLLFSTIVAFIDTFTKERFIQWPPIIASFIVLYNFSTIGNAVRSLSLEFKIKQNPGVFDTCIYNAQPIPSGGKLGVCEINVSRYYFKAIMYDSSDQLNKNVGKRSDDWDKKFQDTIGYYVIDPDVLKIFDHYYLIGFEK